MTSDDLSPMLPQPADDNAPMISGRGTKIIADARGAYQAGNLRGLIAHMDEKQQHQLRINLVANIIWHVDQIITHLPEPEMVSLVLNRVREWLSAPNQLNTDAVVNALVHAEVLKYSNNRLEASDDFLNLGVRGPKWFLLNLGLCLIASSAETACFYASNAVHYGYRVEAGNDPPLLRLTDDPIVVIKHRQLEAAWAILRGKESPPFEVNL